MAAALTGEDVTDMPSLDPEPPFGPPSWKTRRQPSIAVEGVRAAIDRDATWIVIIAGILAIITVGVVIAIDRPHGPRAPVVGLADPVPPPPFAQPSPPVSVLPSPRPSTTSGSLPVAAPTVEAVDHAVRSPSSPAPTAPTSKPTPALWAPGRRVSLQPVQLPGYRVRHHDFRARVDRLDATSRAADRADATFVIRAGLADPKCVSFEAVNFPGRYLRHQNFALFLHPRSGGDLFAADATFCPVAAQPGGPAALRSVNYPGRYVVVRDFLLYLDPVPPSAATLFAARQPLSTT